MLFLNLYIQLIFTCQKQVGLVLAVDSDSDNEENTIAATQPDPFLAQESHGSVTPDQLLRAPTLTLGESDSEMRTPMTAVKGGTGKVAASHRDDDAASWKAKCAALQAELLKRSVGSPPPPTTPPPRKELFTPSPVPPAPKATSQQAAPVPPSLSAVPAAKAPALSGPPLPPGLPATAPKTAPTAPPARLANSKAVPSASHSLASCASKKELPAEDAEGPRPGEEELVETFDLEGKDSVFYRYATICGNM